LGQKSKKLLKTRNLPHGGMRRWQRKSLRGTLGQGFRGRNLKKALHGPLFLGCIMELMSRIQPVEDRDFVQASGKEHLEIVRRETKTWQEEKLL